MSPIRAPRLRDSRFLAPRLLAGPSILLLVGCALTGKTSPGSDADSGAPAPSAQPVATTAADDKPKIVARLPPPVPPPKRRPAPVDPKTLVGMTQDETKQLFGAPANVGDQPPAQVWSYSSAGCGLDIYFYLDLQSQQFKALTYEVTGKGNRVLSDSACLDSLRGEGG